MTERNSTTGGSEMPRHTARNIVYTLTGLAVPSRFRRTEEGRPCLTAKQLASVLRDPDVPEIMPDLCRAGLVEQHGRGRYTASAAAVALVDLTGYVI